MKPQHLSDEAVAAFADGVLSGHARDRACRHIEECAECRRAVKEQREAAAALRTAPAPSLPTNLLDRLRTVPLTTPLPPPPPQAIGPDGSAVLSTFAPMAAFGPSGPAGRSRGRTYLTAAVLAGVTGALVAGGAALSSEDDPSTPAVRPVNHVQSGSLPPVPVAPVNVFHGGVRP
jgi:anti-sigma factor RsiW